MKKILNISIIAALVVSPLGVSAAVTDADPGATTAGAPSATYVPKYNLAQAGAHDDNLVTVGYVKGAYNAAIKAINKVSETSLNAASQTFDSEGEYDDNTVGKAIQDLQEDLQEVDVTQAGVVATVKSATAQATGVSLTVDGTPTGTVTSSLENATMSGTVNMPTSGTVNTLTVWNDDTSTSTATVTLATTSTAISGTVSGNVNSTFSGTGITSGTATGNITGIDVDVTAYTSGS